MWAFVAKLGDMVPERACVVRAGGRDLALVCTKEGLFAIDNACSHSGGSLGEGQVQGHRLTCPLHGWQFDCRSGACLTEERPPQGRYPVKVEGDAVLVEVPEPSEAAAWIAVLDSAELQAGAARRVDAGGRSLALLSTAEGVFALDNACAHAGGSLGDGALEGTTITCPLHAKRFGAQTGECIAEPRYRQATYETKIEAGKIWVRLTSPVSSAPQETQKSAVEGWKQAKHGIDVWPDVLRYARDKTPMNGIEEPDLERMKWYGFFYRKNNDNNHYMVRIRIPGCEMTTDQARAIAYVAHESGYSLVDVTTRGNVQIQGLTIERLPAVRAALERVGLTSRQSGHDNVRNVTSHPWSGIDPEEIIDTRDLAREIQSLIVGNRELSDLPRKFNVALWGRADPPSHAWTQDLSFVAARGPDESLGFQMLLGGNQGQAPKLACHIPVFVRPEELPDVTEAVLRTFRGLGSRHNRTEVRFRYLIERIGPDQTLLEIEKRLGRELQRFPRSPTRPRTAESFVGWFKQKQDDLWAAGVCVPVGRLTAEEFEGMGVVARQHGTGVLRTTFDQNLVIPGIPSSARPSVGYAVARYGLSIEPDSLTRNTVACTGKQFCNIAITETKGYAYQLIEVLRRRRVQLHDIKIHMSGCPSACALTYTADIGLKGVKLRRGIRVVDGFDIYVGGGLSDQVRMGTLFQKAVPFDQLPDVLEKLVSDFYLRRTQGETFSLFWQRKLKAHKAEPLKHDLASWRCSQCGHTHVALDPPPFCPVCAALRAKFEPAEKPSLVSPGEAARAPEAEVGILRAKPSGKRALIVGGGIAAHIAAETLRSSDATSQIALVGDERGGFYNRLDLTRLLAQEIERAKLFEYGAAWREAKQVEFLEGRVISLDPIKKAALLSEGREVPFDVCILAHGSSAAVPDFFRENLEGAFLLRTLSDFDAVIERLRKKTRAAVVGGGVLGIEAACGLAQRGAAVTIFERSAHLMPRQLDPGTAGHLLELVRGRGIDVQLQAPVEEITGTPRTEGLRLVDGRCFPVNLVLVATGIRPNIDWVKRSGIRCQRGIVVDDCMKTNAPNVYAAGDVAEWRGQVMGLWGSALEQGRVAGEAAAGKVSFFRGFVPVTTLKCLGVPLVSVGQIPRDEPGISSRTSQPLEPRTYRRVFFRHGIPVGGILLGVSSGLGELRKLIEGGLELEKLRDQVVTPEMVAGL